MSACNSYRPHPKDAAFCAACSISWNKHSQGVRHVFWDNTDKSLIDLLLLALKRDTDSPCHEYMPVHDWNNGESAPDCACGRPVRPSHEPGDILKGIRAWRNLHPTHLVGKPPCGHFIGSLSTPGTCSVCDHKWLTHEVKARSLAIEAFYDKHESWCKCIIMNGDVECSCMNEQEIQDTLDDIGQVGRTVQKEPVNMGCKQFTPKSTGNTHCKCGTPFHMHSTVACDGHASFLEWRASHLTNHELLTWFMVLPGRNRDDRVQVLKKILTDPGYVWVPPANLVNPDDFTLKALFDTLTGGHLIQSPNDIEKREGKEQVVEQAPVVEPPSGAVWCHGCQEMTSTIIGQLCSECSETLEAASHVVV